MAGTTVSRGNILYQFVLGPTLTPVAVAPNTTAEQAFTVNGLQPNDFVDVYAQSAQTAGIGIVNNRVSAANTLQVGFSNNTGGSLTPVAGVYFVQVTRPEGITLPTNAGS
jgi:hypothetical protein